MLIVFTKVAAIFLMILIGFLANKLEVLPDEAIPSITNLMLYITAPCMAMSTIYSKTLSKNLVNSTLQVITGALVFFICSTLLAAAVVKIFRFHPKKDWGMYIAAIASVNSGFMGFPVTKAIFGDKLFYLMVMHNIILNVYMFGAVPAILNIGNSTKVSIRKTLRSMANIVMLGIIAGVVMLIFGVKPPSVADGIIQMLSDATIPISMILVGMQLGSSDLLALITNRENLVSTVTSMILIPALTFLLVDNMNFLYTDVKAVIIFAAAFPTAVAPVAIAEQAGKNGHGMAEIVSLTTLLSLITVPVLAAVIMIHYY
jgi:predicted permease